MAESIEMPFGVWTWVSQSNHEFDRGPDQHTRKGSFEGEKAPIQDMLGHVRRSIYSLGGSTGTMWMPIGVYWMGSHWRNLANGEPGEASACGGDAALCQIALTICKRVV